MQSLLGQLSDDLAVVSERALQSLVQVRVGHHGLGAGTVVDATGLIVTNAHVVESALRRRQRTADAGVVVRLIDGREAPATVVALDRDRDLAALRVPIANLTAVALEPDPIPTAERLTDAPPVGTVVLALGYPWGVTGGVTLGIVIEAERALAEMEPTRHSWLAASLHLRPGHSGGPMVDTQGRLVGINAMMIGPDVGVAVPAAAVVQFLRTIPAAQRSGETVLV